MGIIFDNNVKESMIYQAYGFTVYGKINRYEWNSFNYESENALITIRIIDRKENEVFYMYMGNNCILQRRIDDTLDNFLWWIAEDKPNNYSIERQVYKCLCASDSLFNYGIKQRKQKQKIKEEENKRINSKEQERNVAIEKIKSYCVENKYIPFFSLYMEENHIINPLNEKSRELLTVTKDENMMEKHINFIKEYPDNKDAKLIKSGTLKEICDYISNQ